jgi:hypothetical protein
LQNVTKQRESGCARASRAPSRLACSRRRARCALGVCAALLAASFARVALAAGLPWEIWESPARLATIDPGDVVLERSSHCLGGCGYDRSNAGAEDPAANPYPLRWLYRDGEAAIVFDERGPGAITRIWVTTGFGTSACIDPAIRVRFYFDGSTVPALDLPLAALFDGSTPPFTPPLVADRQSASGGYVSNVPIAYAEGLRIALVGADDGGTNPCTGNGERLVWFQFQHHRLAPGRAVTTFAPGDDFPAWRAFLGHAGDDPWNGLLAPVEATSLLAPGATLDLATQAGAGWLRGIRLHLPRTAYALVRAKLVLDGATVADVLLDDLFATTGEAMMPARGVLAGEDASGWLYSWLPMPFRQSARIALVAEAALPAPVTVESQLFFDAAAVPPDAASYAAEVSDACVDRGDIRLYAGHGAGKIVGLAARYRAHGIVGRGYLEGDERAYVDAAISPAWYGTGVEDFFGGGFYFEDTAFALPLAGATIVDADGAGETAAYRWLLADPLVYTSSLRLTLEAGFAPSQPVPTCAHTIAHAYLATRASLFVYDRFDVATAAAAAHAYTPPSGASCTFESGTFEDEPPTARSANACAYSAGASRFAFDVADAAPPLRLRRTLDVAAGSPGETAGAPAAEILVDGVVVGRFPPAIADPLRRWQQQDALLDPALGAGRHAFEIVPDFTPTAPRVAESSFELWGGWKERIFAAGFEPLTRRPDAEH